MRKSMIWIVLALSALCWGGVCHTAGAKASVASFWEMAYPMPADVPSSSLQQVPAQGVLVQPVGDGAFALTFPAQMAAKGDVVKLYKIDGSLVGTAVVDASLKASFGHLSRGLYLYRLQGRTNSCGKVVLR